MLTGDYYIYHSYPHGCCLMVDHGVPPRGRRVLRVTGPAEVEETFVQRMGLDWTQAAALMGVHTLGRAQAGPGQGQAPGVAMQLVDGLMGLVAG